MKKRILSLAVLACIGAGCKDKANNYDASGMFKRGRLSYHRK